MARVYNFSAGPSMLPLYVMNRINDELLEYRETGQSVMEMSHRSREYLEIFNGCESKFRNLLGISDRYTVLFLQGGASLQFSMLPMNLMTVNKTADYVLTGSWAEKAYAEALRYGDARIAISSRESGYRYIPEIDPASLNPDADYMHICYNNTIYGTEYKEVPTSISPLVADVSSMILSKPLDVNSFGVLYAGAQKNMGIAGLTVTVIRNDLVERSPDSLPPMLSYKIQKEHQSMYNTPSAFSVYVMSVVLDWLKDEIGGLQEMQYINEEKASVIYDFLDESRLFRGTVEKGSRSDMNICFTTDEDALDRAFCKESALRGFLNLTGYRTVGGMRASIYNGMPLEGVTALRDFMSRFEKEHR